jgi:Flp pilus assembly protein TadG
MRSLLPFRRRRGEKSRQKSRGQSLVEFALVLPVFLVFLAAALDLGRVFYANISLNNAAREGAFEASKHPASFGAGQSCDASDAGRIVCRVQNESRLSAVTVADGDITATCSSGCDAGPGSTVTVNVKGNFDLVTPILSAIFGGQTVNLHSAATAQIEYYPGTAPATAPPPPSADFTTSGSRSCSCPSLSVDFLDLSTGSPSAWQWNFGDGTTSTDQNPSHDFGPGDWTVSLTAINSTDSSTRTKNNYISVHVAGTPTPTPVGTPTATPTPTPEPCVQPPDVIGLSPSSAAAAFSAKGPWRSFNSYSTLTTGPKNKIQAQNPDAAGPCKIPSQTDVVLFWRMP